VVIAPPPERSDADLLSSIRPAGVRATLRRLGCPVVVGVAGWLSWRTGAWIGEATFPWLTWIAAILLFLPSSILLSALLAVVTGSPDGAARAELQARLGQLPVDDAVAAVTEDLADVAPGQRGWVVLLQCHRASDGFRFQARLDLRTDTEPIQGQAKGVRGPRLDLWVRPPQTLEAWDRRDEPLRADLATALADWLEHADLAALPSDTPPRGALRFQGTVIRLGDAGNAWRFSGGVEHDDGSVLAGLGWRVLGALDWSPTANPVVTALRDAAAP